MFLQTGSLSFLGVDAKEFAVLRFSVRNQVNLIEFLDKKYPGLKEELVDDEKLKPTISAVIDGRTTRLGLIQKLDKVSEIHFLPSIAGG